MLKRTFRITTETIERLQSIARHWGYANASAFGKAAIDNELRGHEDTMAESELRLVGRQRGQAPVMQTQYARFTT